LNGIHDGVAQRISIGQSAEPTSQHIEQSDH
jgi:hypothetical protein